MRCIAFKKWTFVFIVLILFGFLTTSFAQTDQRPHYKVITIEGTITAGTNQYLKANLTEAIEDNYDGVIILMDTPGGLVDATLEIMKQIANAPIPVVSYVTPSGAIAASAGTFILMGSHVAAMTPGTTCGAAMPVMMQPGEGGTSPADDKTVQFLAGHLKSMAEEHGRPVDIVERFVTENLTLSAREALDKEVIEFNSPNLESLLENLHGYQVDVQGEPYTFQTENAVLEGVDMSASERLSHFISDPQIAFLLFIIGLYGIIFGLNSPGTIVPEVGGVIAMILALFGLGMFEASTLGIVLIIIAVIFFIAEVFTPTFGVLTAAGVVSLVIGGFFLPVEPMLPAEWFKAFRMTVLGMAGVTAIFLVVVISRLVKLRRVGTVHTQHGMKGYYGKVMSDLNPDGTVKIRGEWWNAVSSDGHLIPKGRYVKVIDSEGITLIVTEADPESENSGPN